MSEIQPKVQEIQKKYKDDKEKQAKETMALYKREKVNPLGGCLPILIQLPILIALYRVFWKGLQPESMDFLYSFVPDPGAIDPTFLGMINLAEASILLAVIAGISQFFQTKMLMPKMKQPVSQGGQMAQFSGMMQKQMLYFFPILTVFILWRLPSAIGIYWIVTALFTVLQQYLVMKKPKEQTEDAHQS